MTGWLAMLALAAFSSALLGGAHCGAMCGAMAGLARGVSGLPWQRLLAAHGGRLASYVTAGALAGGAGQAGLAFRGVVPLQQAMLLASGTALLMTALYVVRRGSVARHMEAVGARLWRGLSPAMRHVVPVDSTGKAIALGVLWGWIPCGMVYAALLLALTAGSMGTGAMVMFAFWAGTLPALLVTQELVRRLRVLTGARRMQGFRTAAGLCMAGAGTWSIAHALHPAWPQAVGFLCKVVGVSP